MSFYNDNICQTCDTKHFIAPGSNPPRHDKAALDAEHPAVSVPLRSEASQRKMLATAIRLVRECLPQAVNMSLQTSDQDTYGFVMTSVKDAAGTELLPDWNDPTIKQRFSPAFDLDDAVSGEINDLEWNGVVGEDACGYVEINLRDSRAAD